MYRGIVLLLSLFLVPVFAFVSHSRPSLTAGSASSSVEVAAGSSSITQDKVVGRRDDVTPKPPYDNIGRNRAMEKEVETMTVEIRKQRLKLARQQRTFEGMSRGAVKKHTANPLLGHDDLAHDLRNAVTLYNETDRGDNIEQIEQSWINIIRNRPSNLKKIDIIGKPQGILEGSDAKKERYKNCTLHLCIGKGGNRSGVEIEPASAASQTETEVRAMQEVTKRYLKLKQVRAQDLFSRVLSTERVQGGAGDEQ